MALEISRVPQREHRNSGSINKADYMLTKGCIVHTLQLGAETQD